MSEKGLIGNRKRLLFITLFIVPFLVGMALIFMGKGIGTLPILHEESEGEYYVVPEFSGVTFDSTQFTFSHQDSSIYVIVSMPEDHPEEWEKHIMYVTKIFKRYNNTKVLTIFEGDIHNFEWTESPKSFIDSYEKWLAIGVDSEQFQTIQGYLRNEVDSVTDLPRYVIVDKEKHIRTYCAINDLKQARDIPKLLKILNNQYAPRKVELSQGDRN